MMGSDVPRRDGLGVALAMAGSLLVAIGGLALWLIIPLAGAVSTIVIGIGLVTVGIRTLLRTPR